MSAISFSIIVVTTSLLLLILTLQSNGLYSSLVLGFQSLDNNTNNNNKLNANDYQMNYDITFLSTSSSSSESSSPSNDFCLKYLETCNGNQDTKLEDPSQKDDIINEFQRKYSEVIEENNNSDTGAGIEAPVAAGGQKPIVPQPMDSNLSAITTITNATMIDNYGLHPPGLE